jgi:MFS family permease
VSLYFAAQAITVLQWGRLSDKVGRKPVLLCGLLGTSVSSLLFGLSRSVWALVLRCVVQVLRIFHSNWVIQPIFEWNAQWERWRHEEHDG